MSYARKKGDGLCCKRVGQEGSFFCLLCHCEKVHVDIDVYITYVYIHVHMYALWMDGWMVEWIYKYNEETTTPREN